MNTENKQDYGWDNPNFNETENFNTNEEAENFSGSDQEDNSSYVDQYQNDIDDEDEPTEDITNSDDAIVNEDEDLDSQFLDALEEDEFYEDDDLEDDEIDESDIDDDLIEDYDENDTDINDPDYQKENYSARDDLDLPYDIDQDLEEKDPVNNPRKF